MSPELSIIIPSCLRPDLLRACLTSVVRHAPLHTEILVVDDGSAETAVSRTCEDFSTVRCLRRERRGGFCVAANEGVRAARAPIVELLNDDTVVHAGWAEAALAHFRNAQVVAVAPLVLRWDGTTEPTAIDSAGDAYYVGGVARKRGHNLSLNSDYRTTQAVFGASASSAFYRRDVLLRVGAFPEEFQGYFEDVDLSFRLRRAGGQIVYEPGSQVWHRVSASYGRPHRRLLWQQARNEELVFWRNLPRRTLLAALPLHLAVLLAKAGRRTIEGQLLPFLLGRLAALATLPAILRHRRWLRTLGPEDTFNSWGVDHHWAPKAR